MKTPSTDVETESPATVAGDVGPETSFIETALALGGKSHDEASKTGAIDRADDQVEVGDLLEEFGPLLLGHAASDAEHQIAGVGFERRQAAELAEHLVLALLSDAAGVEQDEVCGLGIVGALVAVGREHLIDPIGVVLVHLTAEGLDVDPPDGLL